MTTNNQSPSSMLEQCITLCRGIVALNKAALNANTNEEEDIYLNLSSGEVTKLIAALNKLNRVTASRE